MKEASEDRPKRAPLPRHDLIFRNRMRASFSIDFGSFRDIQRHRGGYCSMPIVTAHGGFHPWYYEELPYESQVAALTLFDHIQEFVEQIYDEDVDDMDKILILQYILPMGTLVPVVLDYDYNQALYVAELRSQQTVHATLRPIAKAIGEYLAEEGIRTDCDFSDDIWNIRRGTQTITESSSNNN
jgi:hypothetical protein